RRRHTISKRDWSSDVCSSDLVINAATIATMRGTLSDDIEKPSIKFFVSMGTISPASVVTTLAIKPIVRDSFGIFVDNKSEKKDPRPFCSFFMQLNSFLFGVCPPHTALALYVSGDKPPYMIF